MSSTRRKEPEVRRSDLLAAARKVFFEKGVARSTVSDVVKAAGVAQGTFYLYFNSKNDMINAVVEGLADGMVDSIEKSLANNQAGAVGGILALRDAILAAMSDPADRELAEIYHRPENHAVHERMAERLLPRLVPLVESIVKQGVSEGVFVAENPSLAAWFILGGLHSLELAFKNPLDAGHALSDVTHYALAALGYSGPIPGSTAG